MRHRTLAILAAALALLAPPATALETDLEKFQKALERYAYSGVDFTGAKPKKLCRCLSSLAPVAGWVTQDQIPSVPNQVTLRCAIPSYDSAGALIGVNYCLDWEPL